MGKRNSWVQNPVGYCALHRMQLSTHTLNKRKCVEKNCNHLRKIKQHPYWAYRNNAIKMRAAHKQFIKNNKV